MCTIELVKWMQRKERISERLREEKLRIKEANERRNLDVNSDLLVKFSSLLVRTCDSCRIID